MPKPPVDPVLRSARREAVVHMLLWVVALTWSVGWCYSHGYGRDPATLSFVWGIPDWVFWGIVLPWAICVGLSWLSAYVFMRDEDLGAEPEEADNDG
jgi:hypothetical protein